MLLERLRKEIDQLFAPTGCSNNCDQGRQCTCERVADPVFELADRLVDDLLVAKGLPVHQDGPGRAKLKLVAPP